MRKKKRFSGMINGSYKQGQTGLLHKCEKKQTIKNEPLNKR